MNRVLIVAKEAAEVGELHSGLSRMGFTCSVANNGPTFSKELTKKACDLLLVDMDGSSSSAQNYDVGDVVDNFTLPSATGDSISLYDYWGEVILIHVWHSG